MPERPLTMAERGELIELVTQWVRVKIDPADRIVPARLEATITRREPWRTNALDDARWFLAPALLYGIGMQVLIRTELNAAPYDGWPASVAPLEYRVEWKRDMAGTAFDWSDGALARVVLEDGAWRLAALWDADERKLNREFATLAGHEKDILAPFAPRGIARWRAALRRLWAR